MIPGLVSLLGGGLVESAHGIIKTIWGSKYERDIAIANEQAEAYRGHQAEFQYRGQRFWFDSFVDGLNRLPRPVIAFGVIGLMIWAPVDPYSFAVVMQAYELVPQWLYFIMAQVLMLYFGGRMLEKAEFGKGVNPKKLQHFAAAVKEIRGLQDLQAESDRIAALKRPAPKPEVTTEDGFAVADEVLEVKPMDDDEFKEAMEDPGPMTNRAIMEWNRRRQMKDE
jgi:hypothetical protein